MCDYHSISVHRKGTIAHEPGNSHTDTVYQKRWTENTLTKTHHWDFEYDPDIGPYPGAMECITGSGYAQEPSQRVLDAADEHYRRLEALHKGDYSMLEYFSGEDYADVRRRVARSTKTPARVLAKLAKDHDTWVKCDISSNPNTQTSILEQLAKDKNENVRYHISGNHGTPIEILKMLTKDTDESVRRAAQRNLDHRTKSN